MLKYVAILLLVALVAALLGFGGFSIAAAGVSRVLFFVFLVGFVVTLLVGLLRRT
jgi:uncharacterized membrane protein YtjA (UPF0391 family)